MTRLADRASLSTASAKSLDRASPVIASRRAVERRLKITVLSGGPSAEREVSLKSGRAVADALESLGYSVYRADIAPDDLEALEVPADMVFIALHGAFGEDGQLQRILDERGIRYCGSSSPASAMAMDKVAAKRRFVESGIPTPRFDVATSSRVETVAKSWPAPVVVKPVAEGSSVDCQIVREQALLTPILETMTKRYGSCLVEQYIKGLELTVGILGDSALPPIQIRPKGEFYDYHAKYIDENTEYLFDIDLPAPVLQEVKDLSIKAHQALGCRDFSRVDWMVDGETHRPYALEVNTIPGFTDHSLLPKAARQSGLSFAELCQRIVELALQR